jgi:hypothetical protein
MVQMPRGAGSFVAGAFPVVSLFDTPDGGAGEPLLSARDALAGGADDALPGAPLATFADVVVVARGGDDGVDPGRVVTVVVDGRAVDGLVVDVVLVAGGAVAGADADVAGQRDP